MKLFGPGVLLVFGLLVLGLSRSPGPLYQDEAGLQLNGWCLAHTGRDEHGEAFPLSFRSFGDGKAPLLIYADAALLRLWPGAAPRLFGRYVSAALNAAAFVMLGFIAARLAGRRGLWVWAAPALFVLNPMTYHLSRTGFEVTSFLPLTLAAYLGGVLEGRWALAGGALGLSQYAWHPLKILALPCVLFESVLLLRRRERGALGRLWGGFAALSIPFWYQLATGLGLDRARQVGVPSSPLALAARVVTQYPLHFSPAFLLLKGDVNPRHSPGGAGLAAWSVAALALWGLAQGRRLYRAERAGEWSARLVFLLLLGPLPSAMTVEAVPHVLRAYLMALVLVLIASLAIMKAAGGARRTWAWAAAVLLAVQFALFLRRYYAVYPDESRGAWQAGVQPWLRPGGEASLDLLVRSHPELVARVSGETEPLRWECQRLERCGVCP